MTIGTRDTTRLDDLYTAVLKRIEADDLDGALHLYHSAPSDVAQLDLLHRLHDAISRNLDAALIRTRAAVLDLASISDLGFALDRARALAIVRARALDLDRARALDLAFDLDLTLTRARALGHHIAGQAVVSDVLRELQKQLTHAVRLNRFIIAALGGELSETMVFEDVYRLTPEVLRDDLAPYLQALFDLQRLIDEARGAESIPPQIKTISQNSPVSVEVTGIPAALKILRSLISPYWRKHERELAELELAQKRAEVEEKQIHVMREKLELEKQAREAYRLGAPQANISMVQVQQMTSVLEVSLSRKPPSIPTTLPEVPGKKDGEK